MDMSDKKKEILWVFEDSENLPIHGLFKDCKLETSKSSAVEFPVITLDSAGVIVKLSKWRCDCSSVVTKYGKNSDDWKDKLLRVNKNAKGKLCLEPIEQDIQR